MTSMSQCCTNALLQFQRARLVCNWLNIYYDVRVCWEYFVILLLSFATSHMYVRTNGGVLCRTHDLLFIYAFPAPAASAGSNEARAVSAAVSDEQLQNTIRRFSSLADDARLRTHLGMRTRVHGYRIHSCFSFFKTCSRSLHIIVFC